MTSIDALYPVQRRSDFGWKLYDIKHTIKQYNGEVGTRCLDVIFTDESTEDETGWYY